MSQTWNIPQGNQSAKEIDFALVIEGWPAVYTVAISHAIATTGDLSGSGANWFDATTKPWASIPTISGAGPQARPEEGTCRIGRLEMAVLDKMSLGRREMTELSARQSVTASSTRLTLGVDTDDSVLEVVSIALFSATGGFAYLGAECVRYATATDSGGPPRLTGCSRGRLLTIAGSHAAGVEVYPAMPSLFWRRAFVYKGYQTLPLDQWVRAFGGIVASVAKSGPGVVLGIADSRWLADAGGSQHLLGPPPSGGRGVLQAARLSHAFTFALPLQAGLGWYVGDSGIAIDVEEPDLVTNGHRLVNIFGNWAGIIEETLPGPYHLS